MSPAGFPHSDTLESQLGCQLLEAYRRLLRPSSAPGAKASTVCPYKLATQTNLRENHQIDTSTRSTHQSDELDSTEIKDARVHYAVLKQRTTPTPHPSTHPHHPPFDELREAV